VINKFYPPAYLPVLSADRQAAGRVDPPMDIGGMNVKRMLRRMSLLARGRSLPVRQAGVYGGKWASPWGVPFFFVFAIISFIQNDLGGKSCSFTPLERVIVIADLLRAR
jgi:hypothetical protein